MMGRRQLQTPAGGATATGAATAQAALTVAAGAGSLALAGHVGSQWRRHGLGEAWRKSLHRKGTAFRLHQTGRWLGIYSGLLHFVAVWRMRGLIGVSSTGPQTDEGRARRTRQELREREADLHGWFWLRTGEVNSAQAKLEKSRKQQAGWEQRLLGGSGQASAAGPATENQAAAAAAAPESAMATATIRREDVARHIRREDCWFIIRGKVYDLTSWLREHPGGAAVLLQHAGQDGAAITHPSACKAGGGSRHTRQLASRSPARTPCMLMCARKCRLS
jgi:cytochrome b involved in lipid metabolism